MEFPKGDQPQITDPGAYFLKILCLCSQKAIPVPMVPDNFWWDFRWAPYRLMGLNALLDYVKTALPNSLTEVNSARRVHSRYIAAYRKEDVLSKKDHIHLHFWVRKIDSLSTAIFVSSKSEINDESRILVDTNNAEDACSALNERWPWWNDSAVTLSWPKSSKPN